MSIICNICNERMKPSDNIKHSTENGTAHMFYACKNMHMKLVEITNKYCSMCGKKLPWIDENTSRDVCNICNIKKGAISKEVPQEYPAYTPTENEALFSCVDELREIINICEADHSNNVALGVIKGSTEKIIFSISKVIGKKIFYAGENLING